ncbi:MAG: FlgD immunoglobulin-like domain containing protein [Candidatus Cryosericum sp.]
MKKRKVPVIVALLSVMASMTLAAEVPPNQALWLGYVETPVPREVAFNVPADTVRVGAGYLEMAIAGDEGAIVSVWGSVDGVRRVLDSQCVGMGERRIRLDIGRALSAASVGVNLSVPLTLTTTPLSATSDGAVYLRALASGTVVRLVKIAAPAPLEALGDAENAVSAKRGGTKSEAEVLAGLSLIVRPNPFNPRTIISLMLPVAQMVSIEVYDIRGQMVRTLLPKSQMSAGPHEVSWGGEGDDGRPVASGVYLYVVKAGDVRLTGKLALLK